MARKAAFGSAMHIWKALCAATQAAPIFCRKIVSRFANAAKLPVIYTTGSPAPTQLPSACTRSISNVSPRALATASSHSTISAGAETTGRRRNTA